MNSGTRANIDDMITFPHNIFIMFDNYDGITNGSKTLEIGNQHIIVTRMETD